MNNKMITIPYADAIEYGENTSALFKALWELTDLIRLESDLKKHHRAYLHVREDIDEKVKEARQIIITHTKPVSTPKRISVLWQTTSTMNAMGATLRWMSRDASPMRAMSVSQANAGTGSLTVSLTIFPTNTGLPAQGKPPSVTAPSPFSSLSRERSLM